MVAQKSFIQLSYDLLGGARKWIGDQGEEHPQVAQAQNVSVGTIAQPLKYKDL